MRKRLLAYVTAGLLAAGLGAVLMPSSVRSWALSTSSTGLPRLAASRALNENSVGAPTSV